MLPTDFKRENRKIVALAEGLFDYKNAKTACGVIRYGFHDVVAVIDSTKAGKNTADIVPGIGKNIPIVSKLEEALSMKPDCLLIGVAPKGGGLPEEWRGIIKAAIEAGLHIYSGMHMFMSEDEEFSRLAKSRGVILWDIRRPDRNLPVALGSAKNAKSFLVQTVGTDCSVGKMTAGLEVVREVRRRGVSAEFVSTGQTGILITGYGQPVDAIPGDFMAGAVEKEIMALDGKVDMIFVEGQGSLIHPGYSSVTLGILHGGAPDALILCHQCTRKEVARGYKIPIPPLGDVAKMYETAASWVKPAETIGVALNTFGLDEKDAKNEIELASREISLPADDPVRFSSEKIVDCLISVYEKHQ